MSNAHSVRQIQSSHRRTHNTINFMVAEENVNSLYIHSYSVVKHGWKSNLCTATVFTLNLGILVHIRSRG